MDSVASQLQRKPSAMALACFVAAATYGKFLAAAAAVGVTGQAMSAQIARLEQKLGVELFRRERGVGAMLTEDGRRYLPWAQALLELFKLEPGAAEDAARETSH